MPNFPHNSSTVNMQIINNFTIIHRKSKTQQKKFIKSVQARSEEKIGAGEIGGEDRCSGGEDEIARPLTRWEARSVRSSDSRRDRRARSSDDRAARRSTSALADRRARSQSRLTRGAIVRWARSSDDRAACRSPFCFFSLVGRSRRLSLLPLSLSPIWALSSLSLSLSLFPEMIWTENKSVKLIPGQRSKSWSTGNEFPENKNFRCSQTCGLGWKWFPEIIFTQNKRSLNFFGKQLYLTTS